MALSPVISVIVPCYNVAQYVSRALRSVTEQGYSDWEIVAVDDASTDGTLALLQSAAKVDCRIRVYSLAENGGVSSARNYGLSLARGTHVAFLDPDDFYQPELFASLASVVERNDPQLVVWGARELYTDEDDHVVMERDVVPEQGICTNGAEVRKELLNLEERTLFGYVWNKLYRLDFLQQYGSEFPAAAINEDFFFNVQLAYGIETMVVLNEVFYSYYRRNASRRKSLTAQYLPDYFALSSRRVREFLQLYRCWDEADERVKGVLGTIYVRYSLSALQRNCHPKANMSGSARRAWIRSFYEEDLSKDLIPYAKPGGALAKAVTVLFKARSVYLLSLAARLVYVLNTYLPGFFSALKQSR